MARKIKTLEAAHDVQEFDCGSEPLNTWLRQTARQHVRKKMSQTHCLIEDNHPDQIVGFYTLALRAMTPVTELPPAMQRKLPGDVPGYTLARLAVSKEMQGRGLGAYLLVDAIEQVCEIADQIGGAFLFVDAKDAKTAAFYAKYGFVPLPSNPLILVLSLATVRKIRT
jgi:GNAT superfamily N-acetyltransferase